MARGLSKLQEKILVLAFQNVKDERREVICLYRPDLYAREVMEKFFVLEATFSPWSEIDNISRRTDLPVRERSGWVFERQRFHYYGEPHGNAGRIDQATYNAALASTIRAFDRLEKRKLVKRQRRTVYGGAGIYLTPAGFELAKSLLAADFNG